MELFLYRDGEIKITRATEQKWWETLAIIENKYHHNIVSGKKKGLINEIYEKSLSFKGLLYAEYLEKSAYAFQDYNILLWQK